MMDESFCVDSLWRRFYGKMNVEPCNLCVSVKKYSQIDKN
jgi:hypothetical protein